MGVAYRLIFVSSLHSLSQVRQTNAQITFSLGHTHTLAKTPEQKRILAEWENSHERTQGSRHEHARRLQSSRNSSSMRNLDFLLESSESTGGDEEEDTTAGNGQYQVSPLFQGLGTHYSTVWVGTPPQRKTVIVDTGSHYTAFPCAGCSKCGEEHHTDKYFDPDKSSSFHANSCSKDECETSSKSSCKGSEDHCTFGQSYAEGSSWNAFESRDLYSVGGNTPADGENAIHGAFAIDFMFGCQYSETGLFITQLADGIMGMSGQESTFAKKLFNEGKIPHNMHTMCFRKVHDVSKEGVEAGFMTLGGVDTRLHTSPMVYAKDQTKGGWYTVKIQAMYIREGGGLSAEPDHVDQNVVKVDIGAGKNAIVDSGTTDTYLSSKYKAPFAKAWKKSTGSEYSNKNVVLSKDELARLPTILVQLQAFSEEEELDADNVVGLAGSLDEDNPNDVIFAIPSEHYMQKIDGKEDVYVSRLYFSESGGGVIGANSMRGHDILFDWENHRVGFSESDCAYDHLVNGDDTSAADKESVDCVLAEAVISSSCGSSVDSSSCSTPSTSLTGTEEYTIEIIEEGTANGKSCEDVVLEKFHHAEDIILKCTDGTCVQTHSCTIACSELDTEISVNDDSGEDDNYDSNESCGDNLWGVCQSSCSQVKVKSAISDEDGKCHELDKYVRPCHIEDCLVDNPCHVPFKVHMILGLDGGDESAWTKSVEQDFGDILADVLKGRGASVIPGDLQVLMASKWRAASSGIVGLKLVAEISIYDALPKVEEGTEECSAARLMQVSKVATKTKQTIRSAEFMAGLIEKLLEHSTGNDPSPFANIPSDGGTSKVLESWTIRNGVDKIDESWGGVPGPTVKGFPILSIFVGIAVFVGVPMICCLCVSQRKESMRKENVKAKARTLVASMRNKVSADSVKYAQIQPGSEKSALAEIDDAFNEAAYSDGDFEMQ